MKNTMLNPNRMIKSIITLALIYFAVETAFAQDYSSLHKIKFSAHSDYEKNEQQVLKCVDFIFEGPPDENEENKMYASQFIVRWMEGTPDHTFTIGPDFSDLTGGKVELSRLYIASLVKVTIETKTEKLYLDEVNNRAREIYLDYCANPENKVRNTREVKKILKERGK